MNFFSTILPGENRTSSLDLVLTDSLGNKLSSLMSFSACSFGNKALEDKRRSLLEEEEVTEQNGEIMRRRNRGENRVVKEDDSIVVGGFIFFGEKFEGMALEFIVLGFL